MPIVAATNLWTGEPINTKCACIAKQTFNIELKTLQMAKRKMYNTTLDADLIKEIRILAAQLEKRQNDLLEEAIQDLLEKYKFKQPAN
ncbi:MAG: hypothetical protein PVG35_18195 [Desulfobacterales bacterium]|jgi:hypothetical protein